jgi:hypothetical protein
MEIQSLIALKPTDEKKFTSIKCRVRDRKHESQTYLTLNLNILKKSNIKQKRRRIEIFES